MGNRIDTDRVIHQAMAEAHCELPEVKLEGPLWLAADHSLFIITLVLNLIGLMVVRRYREAYE